MAYNSGDVINWNDERDNDDAILGCLYLGNTLRPENSLVNEIDYFFSLVFKVPEAYRDKFQLFFDDYIKNQIGNTFRNSENTREYLVEFTNGAAPDYQEKAEDDGADFLVSIIITVVETDLINKFNDVRFTVSYTDDSTGETVTDLVKYTSYSENRSTNVEPQTLLNESEDIYWPSSSDLDISFTIPSLNGNKMVDIIDLYRNYGTVTVFTLNKVNDTNPNDSFSKKFFINQCSVGSTGIGPIVYNVTLKRYK